MSAITTTRPALTLTVPVPPSLNNAYTRGRGHGKRVLTKDARTYKARIGELLEESPAATTFAQALIGRQLALTFRLWFSNRQRRDISNCVKLAEDALAEALGFDDCAVDALLVVRAGYDPDRPRCDVVLEIL